MENRTFRGVWWPEGQPENQLSGVLEYSPTSLSRLDLIGDFSDSMGGSSQIVSFDKIFGVSEEGEPITLVHCQRDNRSWSQSSQAGFITSEYVAQIIFSGYHFKNKNIAFDKISVGYYGMDLWAQKGNPAPEIDLADFPRANPGDKIGVSLTIPDEDSAWVDQTQIKVNVRGETSFDKFESGEVTVNQFFSVIPNRTQVPFDELYSHITKLRDFVSLGVGTRALPSSIEGSVREPNGEFVDVDILIGIRASPKDDFGHPHRFLFDLHSINFQQSLPKWYKVFEKYDNTLELYFGALYNDSMYPQNQFIGYCHALEAYHREKYGGKYMAPSDYDHVYDDLIDILKHNPSNVYPSAPSPDTLQNLHSIPSNFVSSLADGTLKYANEYSLRKRIEEISGDLDSAINGLPYSILGKEQLAADTRNYFSHYTDELEKKAALGEDLQELLWGVQQLLQACLLSEIGISQSDIHDRLEKRYLNRWVN